MTYLDQLAETAYQNDLVHSIIQTGTVYRQWISQGIKADCGRLELYTDGSLSGQVALIVPLRGSIVLSDRISVQVGAIITHLCNKAQIVQL